MIEMNDAEFALLHEYLATACAIDVPASKRYLFVTRLQALLCELACPSFSHFYQRLRQDSDGDLRARVIEAMTTNETSFYRDQHPFDTVSNHLLPELAERRLRTVTPLPPCLRLLSAGCSTGEEPYTLGMCACEWLRARPTLPPLRLRVLGVDISRPALEHATRGVYEPGRIGRGLSEELRKRYLVPGDDGFGIASEVRAMVHFARLNLAEPWDSIGKFDMVLCRNVMIYFAKETKTRILDQIFNALSPGGVLILGASETLYCLSDRFLARSEGPTTYYVKPG